MYSFFYVVITNKFLDLKDIINLVPWKIDLLLIIFLNFKFKFVYKLKREKVNFLNTLGNHLAYVEWTTQTFFFIQNLQVQLFSK